jgi:hypothetical protein
MALAFPLSSVVLGAMILGAQRSFKSMPRVVRDSA